MRERFVVYVVQGRVEDRVVPAEGYYGHAVLVLFSPFFSAPSSSSHVISLSPPFSNVSASIPLITYLGTDVEKTRAVLTKGDNS